MNFENIILENLNDFILKIGDDRIQGLQWEVINSNQSNIELKSNEEDIIKFELNTYNDLFASIYMHVYYSKDKCTVLGPDEDPFYNPNNINYSDHMNFKNFTLDRKSNELYLYTEKIVEETVKKSEAYEQLLVLKGYYRNSMGIENIKESIEEVKDVVKSDIKQYLEHITLDFNIKSLEEFVKLMCITMCQRDINKFIHILGNNFEDLSPNCIYDDFLNLSWSGGYEIKDNIIDRCIESTCYVSLLKYKELVSI